jgi:hypothetical protein
VKKIFILFRLDKIWEEMFYIKFFENFSIEECPLLIGIMRLFEDKIDGLTTSEYQFKLLFEDNSLINIQQTINQLSIFKKQCEKNEQGLVSYCLGLYYRKRRDLF